MLELPVLISVLGSCVCALLASRKHRNTYAWAVFGLLFPVIGVVWLLRLKPRAFMSHVMRTAKAPVWAPAV